jgi:hypothetical protein
MANSVSAIVSNGWRAKLAEFYANQSVTMSVPTYFKVGCGGWVSTVDGEQPVDPSAILTDITAGTGSYTGDSAFFFQKNLTILTDLFYISPRRCRVHCFVDTGEGNGPTSGGNAPQFFELGLFDASGTMLVYSTFPMEVKTSDKTLEHYIYIDF